EMLAIYGMGEVKYERYGEIFIREIISYCKKYNKKVIESRPGKTYKADIEVKPKVNTKIGEMYNSGKSISDIMNETKLKKSTILGHLYSYCKQTKLNNPERLLDDSFSSDERVAEVCQAFSRLGTEPLSPIFTELKEKVSYDELHLIRIYYLNKSKI
ncbi:MAG: helix-turn-helix domain-containing protein, partial [bacterium]